MRALTVLLVALGAVGVLTHDDGAAATVPEELNVPSEEDSSDSQQHSSSRLNEKVEPVVAHEDEAAAPGVFEGDGQEADRSSSEEGATHAKQRVWGSTEEEILAPEAEDESLQAKNNTSEETPSQGKQRLWGSAGSASAHANAAVSSSHTSETNSSNAESGASKSSVQRNNVHSKNETQRGLH